MKKTCFFILLMALALPSLFADDAKPEAGEPVKAEVRKGICLSCPAEKLGRGVANLAFCGLEIPMRIGKEMEQADPVAAFVSGAVKGIVWVVVRATVGVFDVATFLIPTKPMIQPFDGGWWSA